MLLSPPMTPPVVFWSPRTTQLFKPSWRDTLQAYLWKPSILHQDPFCIRRIWSGNRQLVCWWLQVLSLVRSSRGIAHFRRLDRLECLQHSLVMKALYLVFIYPHLSKI